MDIASVQQLPHLAYVKNTRQPVAKCVSSQWSTDKKPNVMEYITRNPKLENAYNQTITVLSTSFGNTSFCLRLILNENK